MTRVDSRFCPPTSYSHFHVPTGSVLVSGAPTRLHNPSTSAEDRIAFMITLAEMAVGAARRGPPPARWGRLYERHRSQSDSGSTKPSHLAPLNCDKNLPARDILCLRQ